MLSGAMSGGLLDTDLLGPTAPLGTSPAFPGATEAAGAGCDPGLFLVDDPEPPLGQQTTRLDHSAAAATTAELGFAPEASRGAPAVSVADFLRELEGPVDFLMPSQHTDAALMLGGGADTWRASALGCSAAPAAWQSAPSPFPSIPEEQELPQAHLSSISALGALHLSTALSHHAPSPHASMFVPVPASASLPPLPPTAPTSIPKLAVPNSPVGIADVPASSSGSEAASPTASSTSSLLELAAPQSYAPYPRIASMPNLHLSLGEPSGSAAPAASPSQRKKSAAAAPRARPIPRSRSHSDLRVASGAAPASGAGSAEGSGDLDRYNVPHLPYLTPPHLRKGKGGRQPAADPRLDPNIDPKRARRIMANRLSAAKSKMKQKSTSQSEVLRSEILRMQREGRASEPSEAIAPMAAIEADARQRR